ncbi:uncharacterized protein AC631_02521 [Debaryomyces fabryi]|uniref:Uncharacterized protein n=1 Tax=Debaryomyces fabryi TaxID=58627 RepID=A0A0V1PZN7_9ASCO|nr:uncharacterized protein AC631_02521 [Debaryomyces fabryi]KSA01713.1 hypothetical protein AC631_02521 [Debaryomyces fabryi]CUM45250.1 unnamed protein product [Debaryomyces fabryi]
MSELQSLKKAELSSICRKVGIHVLAKDTKQKLFEKLSAYIESNPEEGLIAVQNSLDIESDEETLAEAQDGSEDEETDEVEEDEEETEDEDKDYEAGPPVNLKEWIIDPAIEFFEEGYSKVLQFTDRIGATTLDYNDDLRENLSRSVSLNYIELVIELVYFLSTYIPLVAVKHNNSVHQVFKDNISYLSSSDLLLPDISVLFEFKVISIFANWIVTSIVLPLIVSYYVNFTRRCIIIDEDDSGLITRAYKYDPFVFALSKVLVFYFIVKNAGSLTTLDSFGGIFSALKKHFLIQLGVYNQFADVLGSFPLVLGFANVLTAIYSQFEEY